MPPYPSGTGKLVTLHSKEDGADVVNGMDHEMGEVILDYLGSDLITGILEAQNLSQLGQRH